MEHEIIRCNFCLRKQHEVRILIAGSDSYICDACTALAVDSIRRSDMDPEFCCGDIAKSLRGCEEKSRDGAPVWKKPEPDKVFWDGEKFLVAIMVSNNNTKTSRYEFYVIRASCDTETPVSFVHDVTDETFDEWDWDDVDWYISINNKDVAGEE